MRTRARQVQVAGFLIYPDLHAAKVGPADENGCTHWIAARARNGYGQFGIRYADTGKSYIASAHRVAYMLAHGEIAPGLVLDHICGIRHCVNVEHLRVCTQKQNSEHRANSNPRNASTGIRGIYRRGSYYDIHVKHNGKLERQYGYASLDAAKEALRDLRNSLHTHNDHDRKATGLV